MIKNSSAQHITLQFISVCLVILYLCIGFVPNWGAVDKIAPQWLMLSIINLLSIIVVLKYKKELIQNLRLILTSYVTAHV